jgi:hypothetical protein
MAWCDSWGQGSHGGKIALEAHHPVGEIPAVEKARAQLWG